MKPARWARATTFGVLLLFGFSCVPASFAQAGPSLAQLTESFAHPPDDCRIMMRWWWFGPAVTKPEIQRELEQMKAAGIGGVEIATLYPLALDDPQTGFRNPPLSLGRIHRGAALSPPRKRAAGSASRYHSGQRLAIRRSAYSRNPGCG